jgi:hypothetical protein
LCWAEASFEILYIPKKKGFAKANTTFTAGERAKDPRKFMVNQLSLSAFPFPAPMWKTLIAGCFFWLLFLNF